MRMKCLDDIQIVVIDGRPPVYDLVLWLKNAPHVWYVSQWGDFPDTREWWTKGSAKNMAIDKFLAESDKRYLLIIDNDTVPDKLSIETLQCMAPVVAARWWGRWGGWAHPETEGSVGAGFIKLDRKALEDIGPDPFTVVEDGECECNAFCRRARAKGILPIATGYAGHQVPLIIMPDGKGGARIRPPTPPKQQRGD